jgi:DNA polymerase-3 subunit delta
MDFMITLLIGENSFEIEQALLDVSKNFNGTVEKFDGSTLQLAQLPDILMGVSLFSTARTVIIRGLSENKTIWSVFGDWLPRISDDIHLVLVEPKPDKRTATFKALKDHATVKEFIAWTDRDYVKAEKWVIEQAKKLGFELNNKNAQFLVKRVGVDQWQLFHAVQKLSMVDSISEDVIKDVIEANPIENVFELFETAISGDIKQLKGKLRILEQTEDIYRLSALLYSQAFQLAAVAAAEKGDNAAKDFGIHPYVAQKLESVAKKVGKTNVNKIVKILAATDDDMKVSAAEPWLLIETALLKISSL